MRIQYRLRQFWQALFADPTPDLAPARAILSPEQLDLFTRQQRSEQAHALVVLGRLQQRGGNQPDLLVAALLHDAGKLRYRLSPLERALVVLVRALAPRLMARWGELREDAWEGVPAWRRAFVVALQHSQWGADLAKAAGTRPLAEKLIRWHHLPHPPGWSEEERALLEKLHQADNES